MSASTNTVRIGLLAAALCTVIGDAHAQHSGHGAHDHPRPPATPKTAAAQPKAATPPAGRSATPPARSTTAAKTGQGADPHAHHRAAAIPSPVAANASQESSGQQRAGDADAHRAEHRAAAADPVADRHHGRASKRDGDEAEGLSSHAHHADHPGHVGSVDHAGHADRTENTHAGHPDHAGHAQPATPPAESSAPDPHAHHAHHGPPAGDLPADHPPREPLPPITDADRAAAFPEHLHGHAMHDDATHSFVLFDRLEVFDGDHGRGQAWEVDAWIGGDVDRLWLRTSGERSAGRTHAADLDVLYGRSVTPWWDVVAGARQSFQPGPSRTFAAIGVQGLAPYMFEVSAMAYAGDGGQVIGELEVEYELLLTNRLILQPAIELEIARRADPARGTGSGLTGIEAGLRLRYEFTRKFAPYIGVVRERGYGDTRDMRAAAGQQPDDTKLVLGLQTWF